MKAAGVADAVIVQAQRLTTCRQVLARVVAAVALVALNPQVLNHGRVEAQTVVESDAPRDGDLVLADEPEVRIGLLDGPLDYIFGEVTGGIRLADGSVVVADQQSYDVRRYDVDGRHLWTSGRRGEGPGEYGGLRLLRGCPGTAAVTVFDWHLNRITELDEEGEVLDTRTGVNPYQEPACAPDGGLVFKPWPDYEFRDVRGLAPGEHYRWEMALVHVEADGEVVALRRGIPGAERTRGVGGSGPRRWGRSVEFAVVATGVWFGSADDYELQHVDWTGRTIGVARWAGPELAVTREHLDGFLEAWLTRYDDPADRRRFEREDWPEMRDGLPERFPAYEALLPLPDGSVWVTTYTWRAQDKELHLLGPDGEWVRRVAIPAGWTVLDAGSDWLLVLQRDELDVQTVAVYRLEPPSSNEPIEARTGDAAAS